MTDESLHKIGDTVTVTRRWERFFSNDDPMRTFNPVTAKHRVEWKSYPVPPETGIFVGWTWVQNGISHPADYMVGDGEEDGNWEQAHLQVTSVVKVAKVQPLDTGQRYRKPALCSIK